jgi:hypothetical protein
MGLETVYVVIEIGTCGDSLPITKPDRLKDHLLAALSKFEAEEYAKGEPQRVVGTPPKTLYDLGEIMAEEHARLQNEGGQNEMVGEIGLD